MRTYQGNSLKFNRGKGYAYTNHPNRYSRLSLEERSTLFCRSSRLRSKTGCSPSEVEGEAIHKSHVGRKNSTEFSPQNRWEENDDGV